MLSLSFVGPDPGCVKTRRTIVNAQQKKQVALVFTQPRPRADMRGSEFLQRKLTILRPISLVANSCFDGLS